MMMRIEDKVCCRVGDAKENEVVEMELNKVRARL